MFKAGTLARYIEATPSFFVDYNLPVWLELEYIASAWRFSASWTLNEAKYSFKFRDVKMNLNRNIVQPLFRHNVFDRFITYTLLHGQIQRDIFHACPQVWVVITLIAFLKRVLFCGKCLFYSNASTTRIVARPGSTELSCCCSCTTYLCEVILQYAENREILPLFTFRRNCNQWKPQTNALLLCYAQVTALACVLGLQQDGSTRQGSVHLQSFWMLNILALNWEILPKL